MNVAGETTSVGDALAGVVVVESRTARVVGRTGIVEARGLPRADNPGPGCVVV